ncbi:MAG: ABC transporter ATP-binding protein [Syntrophus sp. RIFOXYC2_FULL_54_9]|nr:MAG: ABC transporter ATP-binding protein [Syntrophus sp. RIFOXYC2_FULL_54_9]
MTIVESIGLTKNFENLKVLHDVSFSFQEGEILGLIGPNGSGKTTLINCITGNIPFTTGDLLFRGKSIRSLKPHQISQMGITKTYEIAPPATQITALENVMVGSLFGRNGKGRSMREARQKAEEALDFLELSGQKGVPASNLNVFERKRLEVSMVLAMSPRLLLLDEIMGGLNQTEVKDAVRLIKKIRDSGVSILVVEHIMETMLQVSDRVMVLHHGVKITEGSPEQVLKNEAVIKAYLGSRFGELKTSA